MRPRNSSAWCHLGFLGRLQGAPVRPSLLTNHGTHTNSRTSSLTAVSTMHGARSHSVQSTIGIHSRLGSLMAALTSKTYRLSRFVCIIFSVVNVCPIQLWSDYESVGVAVIAAMRDYNPLRMTKQQRLELRHLVEWLIGASTILAFTVHVQFR